MKLRNILLAVKDIEKSRQFYHKLFGLQTVLNSEGNMILTEGLVLQDEKIWREALGKEIIPENNFCELYFEEPEIEAFICKIGKHNIRRFSMSIGLQSTAGDRRWCGFMTWMEI
mgnify:CR=1 FL=1